MSRLLLAGDPLLVREFAQAACQHGHTVAVLPAAPSPARRTTDPLPPGVKTLTRPNGQFDLAAELTLLPGTQKASTLALLDGSLPAAVPILTNSLALTLASQAGSVRRPERLIGLGAYSGVLDGGLLEFALPPGGLPRLREDAAAFARSLGKEAAFVPDLPGMVLPRIRCTLANEACFALAEHLATPAGIDTAMKLGTGYPAGPLEWAERVGFAGLLAVLEALQEILGERYRPAPLLRRAALAGSLAAALESLPPPAPPAEGSPRHGSAPPGAPGQRRGDDRQGRGQSRRVVE